MSDTPIAELAYLGDGHGAALVARDGTVEWCCLPRIDTGSCFGALLDEERGGACTLAPRTEATRAPARAYLDRTLVLETRHATREGEARVLDLLCVDRERPWHPLACLLRVVEGVAGRVPFGVRVAPRFDYGAGPPWIRAQGKGMFGAIAGDDALLVGSDAELRRDGRHDLAAEFAVGEGERVRLALRWLEPHQLDRIDGDWHGGEAVDRLLDDTVGWWREWVDGGEEVGDDERCSTLVLRGLTNSATGAVAAAATTSLPESLDGGRTWDYRYSWLRDSSFAVREMAERGFTDEADAFRRFVQRSAAGRADDVQVVYGVGGERAIGQRPVGVLRGWRGLGPVRVGNQAVRQRQHDVFGEILMLSWRWHERGHAPDDDLWRFVCDVADQACERWREPDHGFWEWPGEPRHFVHSKALCWAALDRTLAMADDTGREVRSERWERERDAIRAAVLDEGVDPDRGCFVQVLGRPELDAALLRLPASGIVAWDDDRMVATADAVRDTLGAGDGLLYRYEADDGLGTREGAFLACSFWLAECLANQRRLDEAREQYERAGAAANDLGLFSEEADPRTGELLGNFPQALTHLSQLAAARALAHVTGRRPDDRPGAPG